MQHRTPEQHRMEVDRWRATAPKDDRDIFHEVSKKSKSPRHGSLADQLAPLLQWMRRPEGLLPGEQKPQAPTISTNWTVVPDNDNSPPKGHRAESTLEITPSIEEIERAVKDVDFMCCPEPAILKGGRNDSRRKNREIHSHPVDGDFERDDAGRLVRLGEMFFSDGTASEKAYKRNGDKLVRVDTALPIGAMLGCREKAQTKLGSSDDPVEVRASNEHFAELLGVELTPYRPSKKSGKKKARAIGATSFTKCKPGLPRGSARVSDSFNGMKKSGCAGNGAQAWEDICTAIVNREMWAETVASLPKQDIEVLEKAMKAESLSDIAPGGHRRTGERRGKRILLAANDNLAVALKKSA